MSVIKNLALIPFAILFLLPTLVFVLGWGFIKLQDLHLKRTYYTLS